MLQKAFSVPVMVQKGMLPANISKTQLPGQMITSIWCHEIMFVNVHIIDNNVIFCDSPEMLVHKPHSHVLTACELPF